MMTLNSYLNQWRYNPMREILAGMVATFALIPEVIAFSYVAGVTPAVSLYASFIISVVIAITGGRPGMVSGAAGSVALVVATLVHNNGVQYLFAATFLTGILQIIFALLKFQVVMRFISSEVKTGFVNALAILIFSAQIPQMLHVTWHSYMLVFLGLIIIYGLPYITKLIPSPLICIIVLTVITIIYPMPVHKVADLGTIPTWLPSFSWPAVPLNLQTLKIIFPYSVAMAAVGILESLMTASVVDTETETHTNPAMECSGLGFSNMASALFGGIAGCGMIGQTVGNLRYGGRGRLSTFTAGAFLLILIVLLHHYVARVPMPALVAIMVMVSISTFSWSSLKQVFVHPKLSSLVMLSTVGVTIYSHNLALGVLVGVLLSGVFFAWRISSFIHVDYRAQPDEDIYKITGQVFFASAALIDDKINFQTNAHSVVLDVQNAHFWDITSVDMLENIISKLEAHHIKVIVIGINEGAHNLLVKYSQNDVLKQ